MLNPFPTLLILSIFAPFVIRVAVALFLISSAYRLIHKDKTTVLSLLQTRWGNQAEILVWIFGISEIAIAVLLIAGFLTQIAALAGIILMGIFIVSRKTFPGISQYGNAINFLLLAVFLSLLFSGAGAFAFDLPL